MDDEAIGWNPEKGVELANALNSVGIKMGNYIADMYWDFREIKEDWQGNNYNRVLEYVNGYVGSFNEEINKFTYVVPNSIYGISAKQSSSGQGSINQFSVNESTQVYEVPIDADSASGNIKIIDMDKLYSHFKDESNIHSVRGRMELTKECLNEYINTLDQYMDVMKENAAIKTVKTEAENYRTTVENRFKEMIDTICEVATNKLDNVSETDMNTIIQAKKIGESAGTGEFVGPREFVGPTMPEGQENATVDSQDPSKLHNAGEFVGSVAAGVTSIPKKVGEGVSNAKEKVDDFTSYVAGDIKRRAGDTVKDIKEGANDFKEGFEEGYSSTKGNSDN